MTVPSNTLLIILNWLIWWSVAVNGQQVKPDNVNTCKLYDLTTGAILTTHTFQVNIQETDNRVSKSQSVIIPIHGQIQQFLYPNSADQTTVSNYGLSIFLNLNTGYNELLVTESIDRDGPNPEPNDDLTIISLNFDCTYASGASTFTQKFEMKILVDDANDNAPVFTNAPYSVNIKEALPISNTVFDNIIATDRDINKNKEIRFTIASGALYNGLSYFDMPNDDLGYVNLVRALDYEALYANSATNFNLVIHARDNNVNSAVQLTTTTTLTVTVEDSDDLPPTFYFPGCFTGPGLVTSCEAAVYRSTLTNGVAGALTFIPTVTGSETATGSIRAFDMDRLNAQIQFSIVGSTPSGFANRFTVSTSSAGTDTNLAGRDIYTATVTQTQVIGRNEVTLLKLFLRASQINDPTKFRTAEIQFTVQANNQNPPQISTNTGSFNGYIYERNNIGETVRATQTSSSPSAFQIIVSDPDVIASDNQTYIYTILEAVPFAVQTSGSNIATIYSTQVLDRESQTVYTFTLRVTENLPTGARSSDQQVQVTVLDVNDNDPTFTGQNLQVQKLEGDYTINNNLLTNAFRPLGDVDVNGNPTVTVAIQSVTVRSGLLTQAEVLNRLALRDDGLYLTGPVSAGLVFAVSLRATDNPANTNQNTRTTDTVVLVEVISAGNNAPRFESANYETGISEASPGGTFVIQVVARDAEDATLTYNLVGNNIADKFVLANSNSGRIQLFGTARSVLDYETQRQYIFNVKSRDSTNRVDTATVTVNVLNANDNAPVFQQTSYVYSVNENELATFNPSVSATDADGDTISYSLANFDPTRFSINGGSGAIGNIIRLNYEEQRQYTFLAVARDNGIPSLAATAYVTVNVLDLDDTIPTFDVSYTGTIQENLISTVTQKGTTSTPLAVKAFDADATPSITYTMDPPNSDFSVNPTTGVISSLRQLNYEAQSTYTFFVTTTQGSSSPVPNRRAQVTIEVIDVNDFSPSISSNLQAQTIPEDFVGYQASVSQPTTLNFVFTGTDGDQPNTANSQISYSIGSVRNVDTNQIVNNDMFSMYTPTTGAITVIRNFDDRSASAYELSIRGTDGGSLSRSDNSNLVVRVNIQRNNAPRIDGVSEITLNDNASPGSVVYTFNATDSDAGRFGQLSDTAPIYFGTAARYFTFRRNSINPAFVELVLNRNLNDDSAQEYQMQFTTRDGGYGNVQKSASLSLKVKVTRNRNPPSWLTFFSSPVDISENLVLTTPVATLQISDLDLQAPHNLMECSIVGDITAQNYFRTEADNNLDRCNVYMKRAPAFERTINNFTVTIGLRDLGTPTSLNGPNNPVSFRIVRNDNPPLFFENIYYATINEVSPIGTSVRVVAAQDSSSTAENNVVTYRIIGDDNSVDKFSITDAPTTVNGLPAVNGTVRTRALFTDEAKSPYTVRIIATDNGLVPRTATALLYVTITRNLQNPVFHPASLSRTAAIPEDKALGSVVVTLSGSDPDRFAPNNEVSYRFAPTSVAQNYFVVDSNGDVFVQSDLKNALSSYALSVEIFDNGTPSRAGVQPATVSITIYKNRAPGFTTTHGRVITVNEDVTTGFIIDSLNYQDPDASLPIAPKFSTLSFSIRFPASASTFFNVVNQGNGVLALQTARSLVETTNPSRIGRWGLLIEVKDDEGLVGTYEHTIIIQRNLREGDAINNCSNTAILDSDVDRFRPVWDHPCSACFAPLYTSTLTDSYKNIALLVQPNRLLAIDAIPTSGSKLFYSIDSGNTHGIFQINSETGEITVLRSVIETGLTSDTLRLAIRVQKHIAGRELSNVALLIVDVNGRNLCESNTPLESKDYTKFIVGLVSMGALLFAVSVVLVICVVRQKRVEKSIPQYEVPAPRQNDHGYERYNDNMIRLEENTIEESMNTNDNRGESGYVYDDPGESRNMSDNPGDNEHYTTVN